MWNPNTDFPNANSTIITVQTSPSAEKETAIIVTLLVACVLSLILAGVSAALIMRRLRDKKGDMGGSAGPEGKGGVV